MVLPEFQKRGFGTYLIRHYNAISDKSGDRTWLPSRPNSIHMFKNEGFKVMGILDYILSGMADLVGILLHM
jgi:ribosomal protein S18 acetylase RimI-like enzyme